MAFERINVGAAANDGTGDPLRTMAQKLNAALSQFSGNLDVFAHARGAWGAGTAYARYDYVERAGVVYVSLVAHSASALFATDLDAGRWVAFDAITSESAENASLAQEAAGHAYDSALIVGTRTNPKDTIAIGLATTATGLVFTVDKGGADGLTRTTTFRNDSGVPVVVLDPVTADEFDGLFNDSEQGFAAKDAAGNPLLWQQGRRMRAPGLGIGDGEIALDDNADGPFSLRRKTGEGLIHVEKERGISLSTVFTPQTFRHYEERKPFNRLADVVMVAHYGQSWAVGLENYAISLLAESISLMFNGGVRTQCVSEDPAVSMSSFVTLVERQDTGTPGFPNFGPGAGETAATGFATAVHALLFAENNVRASDAQFQLLNTAPGEGSKSLEELADNAQAWMKRLKLQISRGAALAASQGKTFCVGAVTWIQASSAAGVANNLYASRLEAMRADIDAYAKAACGQTNDVHLISWQSFPTISEIDDIYHRHVKDFDSYPFLHCAAATYHLDQVAYNAAKEGASLHFTGESTKWLGAAFGLAFKRIVLDGGAWQPLRPMALLRQGKLCTIRFNATSKLKFNTERVTLNENYGFNLYTSAGVEIPLAGVAIVSPSEVRLTANAAIPTGAYVIYGGKQQAWGRFAGNRGNLFDSTGDHIEAPPGVTFGMDMPCVVFRESITN